MAGSQIASICKNAAMIAISEMIHQPEKKSSEKLLIHAKHFQAAFRQAQEKEGSSEC